MGQIIDSELAARVLKKEVAAARRANYCAINMKRLGFSNAYQDNRGVRASHMRAARRIRSMVQPTPSA